MIVDGCSGCMTICEEEGRHSIPWCGVRDMCLSRSHDVRGDRQERKESDQTLPTPTTTSIHALQSCIGVELLCHSPA